MFEKGKVANPLGCRAEDRKVKLLARQHTESAINRLAKWLDSDNPKASVAAACALLDRAYGKPKQTVDSTITRRIVDATRVATIRDKLRQSEKRQLQ